MKVSAPLKLPAKRPAQITWFARLMFGAIALCAAAVLAVPLTEADIIRQLNASPAATPQGTDPDDVFAAENTSARNLGRFRLPDTHGACLDEQTPGNSHKDLVVIPLAPAGAPQVSLSLQFALGKYQLTKTDEQQLNTLAKALMNEQLVHAKFTVSGHTDDIGPHLVNQKLSCARALSVRAYLVSAGIDASRLGAYGFGSSRPVAGNTANTPDNRRVEIRRAEN